MIAKTGIVLVRLPNWLGDTVMALPALHGLRAARSGVSVVAVGRWAGILAGQGVADALVPYPAGRGERRRLNASLRDMRTDAAILLPNSFGSAFAACRWRARVRLGYDTDLRRPLLTHAVPLPSPRLHQVDEYRLLLEAAGVAAPATEPAWRLGEDAAADGAVSALLDGPFAELATALRERGLQPLLLGSPADAGIDAAVRAAADWAVPSLVGRDSPEILPRLLSRLTCLVSGDTGVAHLAAAVGTPTVTLFGPTDPTLTVPRGRAALYIHGRAPCAPCFLERCPIDHVCMRDITAASVVQAVTEARAA